MLKSIFSIFLNIKIWFLRREGPKSRHISSTVLFPPIKCKEKAIETYCAQNFEQNNSRLPFCKGREKLLRKSEFLLTFSEAGNDSKENAKHTTEVFR